MSKNEYKNILKQDKEIEDLLSSLVIPHVQCSNTKYKLLYDWFKYDEMVDIFNCIMSHIRTYDSEDTSGGGTTNKISLRKFFGKLERLKTSKRDVYYSDFNGDIEDAKQHGILTEGESEKRLFIVKTEDTKYLRKSNLTDYEIKDYYIEGRHTVLLEIAVGIFGTNLLREYIPNFAFIFGYAKCGLPFPEVDMKTRHNTFTAWCTNRLRESYYIIYEYVHGITLTRFSRKCPKDQFLFVYIQLLLALYFARIKIDFTHYDLWTDNIVIRELDKPMRVKYLFKGKEYYIVTSIIPTIIDYGRSHIKYKDKPFGQQFYRKYRVYSEKPNIITDAFAILITCADEMYHSKNTALDLVLKLSEFFDYLNIDFIREIEDRDAESIRRKENGKCSVYIEYLLEPDRAELATLEELILYSLDVAKEMNIKIFE